MGIWSTIDCTEESNTRRESVSLKGDLQLSVTLRCAWEDRWDLVDDLLFVGGVWPEFASWDNPPLAQSAKISPVVTPQKGGPGVAGQEILYGEALVDVVYGLDSSTDLAAESLESSAQFARLDYQQFRWQSDTAALLPDQSPGQLKRGLCLARTVYKMLLVPSVVLQAGSVNQSAYTSSLLGITFDEETLLLQPANISRTIRTDGTTPYNVATKLLYRPDGWNKYYRAATDSWDYIEHVANPGSPFKSYPPVDMSAILF